jgi:hypothetical protein
MNFHSYSTVSTDVCTFITLCAAFLHRHLHNPILISSGFEAESMNCQPRTAHTQLKGERRISEAINEHTTVDMGKTPLLGPSVSSPGLLQGNYIDLT